MCLFLNHTTAFHFYLLFNLLLLSPYFEHSFLQAVMFPFLYNIMYLFICISSCFHIFLYYKSVCDAYCISFTFSSSYVLTFHYDFPISCLFLLTYDFYSFAFHFYTHVHFYISSFIPHLLRKYFLPLHLIASHGMCSFLQQSRFCWHISYTPPFSHSAELACLSSCLPFCPSLCKFFSHTSTDLAFTSHNYFSFLSPWQ